MTSQLPELRPPFAAQPDIVLASQKDQFHINEFRDDLYSFFERVLNPTQTFGAKAEILLMADFLYYFLTKGKQTLGEEYCDVFLFESDGKTRFRKWRLLLTVCLAIGPYLANRIELGGWQSLIAALRRRPQQQRMRHFPPHMQQQQQQALAIPKRIQDYLLQLISVCSRVHLAVFYYRGDFLSPIHRLFGARYMFTREPSAPRPGFSLLSYFIAFQLSVEFVQQAWARFGSSRTQQDELASIVPSATMEEEAGRQTAMFTNPCGICLSKITAPACPPCGHVYCYECIVESTIAKPECPLCRRESEPQSILCIYE